MAASFPEKKNELIKNNLVYMENITVRFGKVIALEGVNFRVGKHEIVGLLGDNGAGKTTLVKSLIGYHPITTGEIFFNGHRVQFTSPKEARLAGIETAYQDLALFDFLNCSQNFFLGKELSKRIGPFAVLDHRKMRKIVAETLEEMGFKYERYKNRIVGALPGGEKQAIAVGRAYYFGTKLLILDEPTAALSESEAERVLQLVMKAKQRGLSVIFVTHKSHEVFEVADRFFVLQNGKAYADLNKEDVTPKQIEKLLISSRLKMLREMAAGVAHQVRNPLGVMKLSVEMLRDEFHVEQHQEDYDHITHMLIREIDTLNLVVNNFLDFARPPKTDKKLCSLQEIIMASLKRLPLDDFPGIEIIQRIQEGIPDYLMDRDIMKQVISNLVLNALQASPPHSKVEIRGFMENGGLIIEIQDWGCGLDEKTRNQIFHPFFTTKTAGTGLGLSIVQRFVEQLQGTIDVWSIPGKGTTFRIVL
jgi:simple sugar transport system ATP-binding protein